MNIEFWYTFIWEINSKFISQINPSKNYFTIYLGNLCFETFMSCIDGAMNMYIKNRYVGIFFVS